VQHDDQRYAILSLPNLQATWLSYFNTEAIRLYLHQSKRNACASAISEGYLEENTEPGYANRQQESVMFGNSQAEDKITNYVHNSRSNSV
jgi:hypothetical protein